MSDAGDVREIIEERPDLEPVIEATLSVEPPFDFDDVDVDSGRFGELVSRGILVQSDEGYRLADPKAVRRALAGDVLDDAPPSYVSISRPSIPITRLEIAYLTGAVALVVTLRLLSLPNVYYEGFVVLSSNDPYYYRYLVERLLTDAGTTPGNLGPDVARGEPLLVTSLWFISVLLGGSTMVAGHVIAWYPVVSAAITSVLVYVLALFVTGDRRIGVASMAMLAIIPGHAVRTSLGFSDHHAFDFLLMTVTLVGITGVITANERSRSLKSRLTLASTATIAIGVSAQTLAWDNSPIILAVIGGYLALEGPRSLVSEIRPYRTVGPVVAGVVVGALITWLAHVNLGWHSSLVVAGPVLLAIGGLGVLVGAEIIHMSDFPSHFPAVREIHLPFILVGFEVAGLLVTLYSILPTLWDTLGRRIQGALLAERGIAETLGLFGEGFGWLLLLGFTLFIGLPYLVWATLQSIDDARWLPSVTYTWYFLGLSMLQVRFVGELAPVLALFAGLGFVHLAERIDVVRRPNPFADLSNRGLSVPTSRQFGALVVLFLLVGSLGLVQVPVKTGQVVIENDKADAAFWMARYSDENQLAYPSNYVFSEWGRNRMYNYFVNGESASYSFAQSNFEDFHQSTDSAAWYRRLDDRLGFVVTTAGAAGTSRQLGTRLHDHMGFSTEREPALAHFRFLHATGDGSVKIFRAVPGAVITGTAPPNTQMTARTTVDIQGESYSYVRSNSTNQDGEFFIRVAQPGTYRLAGSTIEVNESAVNQGFFVRSG